MDLTRTPGYVSGFPLELNLRELGGIRCADGRHVRHGLFYRGSALVGLSAEERALVEGFHLSHILDLRAEGEVKGYADFVPHGTSYQRVSGMYDADDREVDFSPAGIARLTESIARDADLMVTLYTSMMRDNPATHALIRCVTSDRLPLYFHCSAGKDRTGVCAALILLLLGADTATIVSEYLLTNAYRASIIASPPEVLPSWIPADADDAWAQVVGVSEKNLLAALAVAGDTEEQHLAYLMDEFGLTQERIERIRERCLE